jgi:HD-GYP domain-containing protein (c-di-GMP phosphodiesterase class II)
MKQGDGHDVPQNKLLFTFSCDSSYCGPRAGSLMLRRFFNSTETVAAPDPVATVETLLTQRSPSEQGELVLRHLQVTLEGDIRGYIVSGTTLSGYRFLTTRGYSSSMLDLIPQHGPWRDPGPRIVQNLIQELFTPNEKEMRTLLSELGMREAKATLVVPLASGTGAQGALVLHRHSPEGFTEDDLKVTKRWGRILGEALSAHEELSRTRKSLVEFTRAFVEAMEAQDFTQLGHAQRVTSYSLALGRTLELKNDNLFDLYFAAMLHDIGKLGTGTDLSVEDSEHPSRGANLIASSPLLTRAADGIRHHHERWDGSGFPEGRIGEAIPLMARIIAVADAFDLLSSERGQALPMREVEKALEARAKNDLDPKLVNLFINILRRGKTTAELAKLEHSELPF